MGFRGTILYHAICMLLPSSYAHPLTFSTSPHALSQHFLSVSNPRICYTIIFKECMITLFPYGALEVVRGPDISEVIGGSLFWGESCNK